MPVPPRCPFHQHAGSTKMPVPSRCPFHQDARSIKMPIPPTCPFHNNMQRLLTLPVLKERGFLDQRAALNRRIPIFNVVKNRTVLNQKPVKTKFSVNLRQTQRAILAIAFGYL
ncbi:hypothetical protein [Moorena producens]|uniref:hypothetical protein n=1 Tax=Moorena producens TaxID=1155739 RepID=UPI003C75B148